MHFCYADVIFLGKDFIMKTKDSKFYRKLWWLMIPIVLQNLMLAMVAVADAFMLGGVDQNYMSAVSLATQIQFIQNMFLSAENFGTHIGLCESNQTVDRHDVFFKFCYECFGSSSFIFAADSIEIILCSFFDFGSE